MSGKVCCIQTVTCCCCDSVTAHGSLADDDPDELSTVNTELEPDTDTPPAEQNLGPMMILGCGILRPSDLFSQQYPAY